MFAFDQELLIKALKKYPGVAVVSYGRPRDAFELPIDVPFFKSGYGGVYEMPHSNVPAGTMIGVGDIEALTFSDFEKLKENLSKIDIYPMGGRGDFTGKDVKELKEWFSSRSRLDNEINPQTPISSAKKLSPEGLGVEKYDELVSFLADNMNVFKGSKAGELMPPDRDQRRSIAAALLDGLSKTVRYTRLDDPATAFQFVGEMLVEKKGAGVIHFGLIDPNKVLILRAQKNGEKDLTPLDRSMIGRTYVTQDGQPLGTRGSVDISEVLFDMYCSAGQPVPAYLKPAAGQPAQ